MIVVCCLILIRITIQWRVASLQLPVKYPQLPAILIDTLIRRIGKEPGSVCYIEYSDSLGWALQAAASMTMGIMYV